MDVLIFEWLAVAFYTIEEDCKHLLYPLICLSKNLVFCYKPLFFAGKSSSALPQQHQMCVM